MEPFGPEFAADVETQKGFRGRVSRIVIQHGETAVFVSTHLDHRVDGKLNGVTESVERHRRGIDQESHVVDHGFDNGKRTRLRSLWLGWVVRAQQELSGLSLLGEIKVGKCVCVQHLRIESGKIIGGDSMKICFKKRLREVCFRGSQPLPRPFTERFDQSIAVK